MLNPNNLTTIVDRTALQDANRASGAVQNSSLDQTAFLRLMTTQLKAQDPFSPMDNTQMVAQMAQFSSVAGISEMNGSLKAIADQLSAQTDLLADIKAATSSTSGV
jgi:flagellar basal-body rod modification protein FlgD